MKDKDTINLQKAVQLIMEAEGDLTHAPLKALDRLHMPWRERREDSQSQYDHRTLIKVKNPISTSKEYFDFIKSKDGKWFRVLSMDENLNPPYILTTSIVKDSRDAEWLDSELQKNIDYVKNSD